jgi:hypothetical protein
LRSDEIFQPDLLAKFAPVPIYNELGIGQRSDRSLRRAAAGEAMTSFDAVDLDTYCGRIGNLYGRYGLSPPFALRHIAADWQASGIALSHIVAVINRHLTDHRRRYNSGSGDALFSWVDEIIRKTWREQYVSPEHAKGSRPTIQRMTDVEWVDRQPGADYHVDRRRSSGSRELPPGNQSDASGCSRADQMRWQTAEPIGPKGKRPKQIDRAITFLRRELADREVAAARLEEKAKASGISPRTLDRARAQLEVISRRTGFAKEGKCWLSLPTTP